MLSQNILKKQRSAQNTIQFKHNIKSSKKASFFFFFFHFVNAVRQCLNRHEMIKFISAASQENLYTLTCTMWFVIVDSDQLASEPTRRWLRVTSSRSWGQHELCLARICFEFLHGQCNTSCYSVILPMLAVLMIRQHLISQNNSGKHAWVQKILS